MESVECAPRARLAAGDEWSDGEMRRDGWAGTITAPPAGGGRSRGAPSEAAARPTAGAAAPESSGERTPSQRNEEALARLFEAFSRRDLPSALALVHPEVVFQPMTAAVTRAGEPYRGHEGIRRYAEDVETHWARLTIRPKQIRSAGRAVVALGLVSGSGRGGSFEDAPTTWVVKFRDGMVAHAQIFSDERNVVSALVGEDG
jgi:ketosteroid isomerase-like protein